MGNFVSKPPFDLTAFLSQKATPSQTRFRGRPSNRFRPTSEAESAMAEESNGDVDDDLPKAARSDGSDG